MARHYLNAENLPPRPDPVTALPTPPKAPWNRQQVIPPEQDRGRERDPSLAPGPPPGQGPVLFWHRSSRRGAAQGAIFIGVVIGGVGTLTRGIDWITVWQCWAAIAASALLIYAIARGGQISAGSDWSARGSGKSMSWVRTYELVSVKAQATGSGLYIEMKDSGGRRLSYKMIDIIADDPRIWDYTYNGILHSVIAGGAETNKQLHLQLKLPYPESARPESARPADDSTEIHPDTG